MFYGFEICSVRLDACVQSFAAFEGYFKSFLFLVSLKAQQDSTVSCKSIPAPLTATTNF